MGGGENSATGAIVGVRLRNDLGIDGGTVLVFGLRAENPALPYNDLTVQHQSGQPGAGEVLLRHVFRQSVYVSVDFAGSVLDAGTAADSEAVFTIKLNGTQIGTITVAAAGTTGTFAHTDSPETVDFSSGDVLTIEAPGSQDATLADVAINIDATTPSP